MRAPEIVTMKGKTRNNGMARKRPAGTAVRIYLRILLQLASAVHVNDKQLSAPSLCGIGSGRLSPSGSDQIVSESGEKLIPTYTPATIQEQGTPA